MRRTILVAMLALPLLLMAICPAAPARAQTDTATPTITVTPISTRAAASSAGYTLPSGGTLVVEHTATLGEALVLIALICVLAVLGVMFVYRLALDWGK